MENQIQKFEPQNVRLEVVKQLETMQAAKFIALPENYRESAFFAIDKLVSLQGIENVPAPMITKALIKMFRYKLDYLKNHCYFFVENDKTSPTGKGLRFGWQYQGLVHVGKTQCSIYDTIPVLVHEDDVFKKHYEYGALIIDEHIPTFEGKIIGGYCVVGFSDKRRLVKYYTKAELDKRRDKSQAKNGQFWSWEREMYEKTLINATVKRIVETSGGVDAEDLYNEPAEAPRQIEEAEVILQPEPTATAKFKM